MSKRRASMQCKAADKSGVIYPRLPSGQAHPAHGARVQIVTNRCSGLRVMFTENHGPYRKWEEIVVSPTDFAPSK